MDMKIRDQRKFLHKKWKVVPLNSTKTANDRHRKLIKKFTNDSREMIRYLQEDAWEDDKTGRAKVYLVLERKEKGPADPDSFETKRKRAGWELVGYFALKSGMLYTEVKEEDVVELSPEEDTFLNKYVTVLRRADQDPDYEGFVKLFQEVGWSLLASKGKSEEEIKLLFALGRRRYQIERDRHYTQEEEVSQLVESCHSAVELTHLAKNNSYQKPDGIELGFSSYIFWEEIVPMVQEAAEKIGIEYMYLFAAQNRLQDPLSQKYDPGKNKLIQHYSNNLSFRLIDEYKVLKPAYDYSCFSMIQEVSKLSMNRIAFWERHSDEMVKEEKEA